ncbi:MAG: folate-binding protein YgfZ [Piscirickettsiaceae bacterium]|nr:MAG: folate-binding protein YgfZ [Piscirickettsiaceae bacterium]
MTKLYDLSTVKSLISFSGSDAESFLQGQTTCDVASLTSGNSVFGALCNPKGRAISLFHLFKVNDTIYMLINSGLSKAIIKRLKMFVFRSDVQIADQSDNYAILGAESHGQEGTLSSLKPLASFKLNDGAELIHVILNANACQQAILNNDLSLEQDLTGWKQLNTFECFPELTTDTSELFIPQMLNLDLLDGINFQKGCYTGQEVIARLHYKGSVKKRLVAFQSANPFKPGENIHLPGDTNSIGTILSSTEAKPSEFSGLVVLKIDVIKSQKLTLNDDRVLLIQLPKYELG